MARGGLVGLPECVLRRDELPILADCRHRKNPTPQGSAWGRILWEHLCDCLRACELVTTLLSSHNPDADVETYPLSPYPGEFENVWD
jgi:hypothetical protein